FDVVSLEGRSAITGMGAVGNLERPIPLATFVEVVAECLGADGLRYSGSDDRAVARVAVCGGSGSGLIGHAVRAGADAFVTGDISYHRHFELLRPDGSAALALIDAGHYETERPVEEAVIRRLRSIHTDIDFV